MKRIFKYPLEIVDKQELSIPGLVSILSVATQRDHIVLYAVIDESQPVRKASVYIIGTGNPMNDEVMDYDFIGTTSMMDGRLMWHVFVKGIEQENK